MKKILFIITIAICSCATEVKDNSDYLTQVEKEKDSIAQNSFNLGVGFLNAGFYQEAITYLDEAIEIYPNYEEAYFQRGITNQKQGFHAEAIIDFDMVIELNPDNDEAHSERGRSNDLVRENKLREVLLKDMEGVYDNMTVDKDTTELDLDFDPESMLY